MRLARGILIGVGLVLLVIAGLVLLDEVSPDSYGGILVWFGGALLIHDGILAPVVFGISVILRKTLTRGVIVIVQGALVIGALFTAIVLPEYLKKGIGSANETLLPLDYGRNLVVFYIVLVVLTVLALVIYSRVRKRRTPPQSSPA